MEFGFTTAAYVVAAVLFILSLGGLSGQESAKRAVWYGIVGMALAVSATLIGPGSGCGCCRCPDRGRRRDRLSTGAPGADDRDAATGRGDAQPCRSGRGLCGLQRAFRNGQRAGDGDAGERLEDFAALLAKKISVEISILRVELFLGIFIGAITFTGSVIAYGKLAGKVDVGAKKLPGGHMLNAVRRRSRCSADLVLQHGRVLAAVPDDAGGAFHRLPSDHGHRRRGYAGRCVDAEQLFRLGGGGDWFQPWQRPADRCRCAWSARPVRSCPTSCVRR